jgi:hypothetical protein
VEGGSGASGPEVDVGPLVQQVADDLHPHLPRGRCERRVNNPFRVQQLAVLLEEAPYILKVTALGRRDDGPRARHGAVTRMNGPVMNTCMCWGSGLCGRSLEGCEGGLLDSRHNTRGARAR